MRLSFKRLGFYINVFVIDDLNFCKQLFTPGRFVEFVYAYSINKDVY